MKIELIEEMNIMKNILCPISEERINEKATRLNAFFGILLIVSGFALNSVIFFVILLADFYIRAFTKLRYSPISYLSHRLADVLNLVKKPIDKAPKIFAARIGFLFTLAITVLSFLDMSVGALVVGGVLAFFASLEFVLGICMGCLMYTYLILPFYKS